MSDESSNDTLPHYTWPLLLAGQKALVTGANSGIGKAVATGLGRSGADVAINYITDEDVAEAMVKEIEGFGVKAIAVKADVSNEDEVRAMFNTVLDAFGTLDILVANAGLQRDAAYDEMTLEQWNKVISVNLTGQFLCTREAVKEFKRRGVREEVSAAAGKIICMSSVHQVIPWSGHANYASSKGGIDMLMQSMAQELAPLHIRINSIAPGAIRTPINRKVWDSPDAYAKLMKLIPYQRIGEPEDIAQAAVYLASDMSDYVNGSTLFVDGGMTCYPGFATGG
ncbi:MAG: SDR family oxidoreductase [Thiohalocapsa sp.]|uniref:SDR family oxidoreductase n=1 Tax=Thiohalocapsa sp. TaxID=2497641 RepID=UPI0025D0EAA7|nr:SDR family oxidoreductase [Thiohalocapsa sp.]MCG6941827.1 SDR family oxidoreductase [Thiohalocapsa sp.]